MKKFLMILVLFVGLYIFETKEAKAVKVTITVVTGKGGNCEGRGICSVSIEVSLRAAPTGGTTEVIDGTAEVKGDKLYVTLSKGLSDKAVDEKGMKTVNIRRPQQLSPDVAKQLGFNSLSILPSDYVVDRNTIVFDIKGTSASNPVKGTGASTRQ
jgi:hypothetical protein